MAWPYRPFAGARDRILIAQPASFSQSSSSSQSVGQSPPASQSPASKKPVYVSPPSSPSEGTIEYFAGPAMHPCPFNPCKWARVCSKSRLASHRHQCRYAPQRQRCCDKCGVEFRTIRSMRKHRRDVCTAPSPPCSPPTPLPASVALSTAAAVAAAAAPLPGGVHAFESVEKLDECLARLAKRGRVTPFSIHLDRHDAQNVTAEQLGQLLDALLRQPNRVVSLQLYDFDDQLDDSVGSKLAWLLERSSRLVELCLVGHSCSILTYSLVAKALRSNSTLSDLSLWGSSWQQLDCDQVDGAFVEALVANENRPLNSLWKICNFVDEWEEMDDYERLCAEAAKRRHRSMRRIALEWLNRYDAERWWIEPERHCIT